MTAAWPRLTWREWLRHPVVIALLISVLLHAYLWLMAVLIDRAFANGWLPAWMQPLVQPAQALLAKAPDRPPEPKPQETGWEEIPLQFIEVDPALVTEETPKDSKFYSTANTLAANPDPAPEPKKDPRIAGFREDSLKTFDTLRPNPNPQPAQPKQAEAEETVAATPKSPQPAKATQEAREERGVAPGDTLLAKVDPKARDLTPQPAQTPQSAQPEQAEQKPRYKRVADVRREKGMLVGERMKMDGNSPRVGIDSSLDVKASPLGDYNYRLVQAVQERWYQLLDERKFALERAGKAVIKFTLHADGTVSDVRTDRSTVGDTLSFLCELSIMQPAPYGKWPSEVRRLIGRESLDVTFTFNYY